MVNYIVGSELVWRPIRVERVREESWRALFEVFLKLDATTLRWKSSHVHHLQRSRRWLSNWGTGPHNVEDKRTCQIG